MVKKIFCDKCGNSFEDINGTLEVNGEIYDICGDCFNDILILVKGGKD